MFDLVMWPHLIIRRLTLLQDASLVDDEDGDFDRSSHVNLPLPFSSLSDNVKAFNCSPENGVSKSGMGIYRGTAIYREI